VYIIELLSRTELNNRSSCHAADQHTQHCQDTSQNMLSCIQDREGRLETVLRPCLQGRTELQCGQSSNELLLFYMLSLRKQYLDFGTWELVSLLPSSHVGRLYTLSTSQKYIQLCKI